MTALPTLPAVGAQVMPKPGTVWAGRHMPQVPHTVVAVDDLREATGDPGDVVLVIQLTALVGYANSCGELVNTESGAYLGIIDVDLLDAPPVLFLARPTNGAVSS